jgi:heat shock protein HslJ
LILLAVALLFGGAQVTRSVLLAQQTSAMLSGTNWDVQSYKNGQGSLTPVLAGSALNLAFGSDGHVSGSSGCNNFGGPYTINGSSLAFGMLISTLRACISPDLDAQEQVFMTALGASTMLTVNGSQLVLSDAGGHIQVTLTQEQESPSLSGTSWLVRSYNNGLGGVATVPAGVQLTVNFGDDGVVSGSTGCNSYRGLYTEDGSSVTLGALASTLRACLSSDATNLEQAFLAALGASSSYEISGIQLTLRDADGNTQLVLTQQRANTLSGTAWRVQSVNNGRNAVASLVSGSQLSLVLGDDGVATGDTGCNSYRGLYTSDATSLSFGPLITTRRACTSDALAGQEQAFLAALSASSMFELIGDQLTVRDVNGSTQFTAVRPSVQPLTASPVP